MEPVPMRVNASANPIWKDLPVIVVRMVFMTFPIAKVIYFKKSFFFSLLNLLSKACKCDDQGRENNICNKKTGHCDCNSNIKGDLCEECADNHYDFPTCKACHCNKKGSKNKACNIDSGDCDCLPNVFGQKCDKCQRHYYPDPFPDCKGI